MRLNAVPVTLAVFVLSSASAQEWTGHDWDVRASLNSEEYDTRIRFLDDEISRANRLVEEHEEAMAAARRELAEEKLLSWITALAQAEENPKDATLRAAADQAYKDYITALGGDDEQWLELNNWASHERDSLRAQEYALTVEIQKRRETNDYHAARDGWENAGTYESIRECLPMDNDGNPQFNTRLQGCAPGDPLTPPPAGRIWRKADGFLYSDRFTWLQPALKDINAHHAYAWGLTGAGVRIGIHDDGVNYRLSEFEGRVSFVGAELLYWLDHDHDTRYAEAQDCYSGPASDDCHVFEYDGLDPSLKANGVTLETLNARSIILQNGWAPPVPDTAAHYGFFPVEDEDGDRWTPSHQTWYVRHTHPCADSDGEQSECFYFSILPSAGTHGTLVASVAAGRDFGVAPGATIIPIAKDFSLEGQQAEESWLQSIFAVSYTDSALRASVDAEAAALQKTFYENFDIINRSYGISTDSRGGNLAFISNLEDAANLFPKFWKSLFQADRHPDDRTILVYAAGNDARSINALESALPYYIPLARGHHLSAMAIGPDGLHLSSTVHRYGIRISVDTTTGCGHRRRHPCH